MFRHNQVPPDDDPPDLVKLCLDATIGISYNGVSGPHRLQQQTELLSAGPFFVAARVRQFTVSTQPQNTPFDPMDLTVPVALQNDDQKEDEWDSRNDECIVEITQVFLRYDGSLMGAVFIASPS